MKLGFATPISLRPLQHLVERGEHLPAGYEFAPAVDWLHELLRQGHSVTVYTTARDIGSDATFTDGDRLTVRIVRARRSGAGRDLFRAERAALTCMMAADACDVIHAHWTYEFALAALASGRPTLITVHDLPWNVLRYFRDGHRLAKVAMAYHTAWQGRHFTAVSADAARHFRRYFAPWARVAVVPNGLPDAVFAEPCAAPRPPDTGITFATNLQGWSARKNAAAALRAFAAVRQQIPDARLLMFGKDYEAGGTASQWASRQRLTAGVSFVGQLSYSDLLGRMAKDVDVLVHPSLDESFSMASLEAMALRNPVIAGAQTPGVREVLGYGSAGVLVDVTRPQALAAAMIRLATDPAHLSCVAEAGYARASGAFRLRTVFCLYQALYQQLHDECQERDALRAAAPDTRVTPCIGRFRAD